ncbi:MAG: biopolymer transporter TolR, partial [Polyangiaceae bacterium]
MTANATGIFEGNTDVGENLRSGKVEHAAGSDEYRVTGGGANIWSTADAFHFVYKRLSGDLDISADIDFVGSGVEPHRKVVLMVRQDLSAGSAYADVCVHADGLTSLQFRRTAGGKTEEARSSVRAPNRIRLERRGNSFRMQAGEVGHVATSTGPE